MSFNSRISWTDSTWNPTRGCTKISQGCSRCYAETFSERWRGIPGHPFEQGFDLRLVPENLETPLHWRNPKRIFVNSMSDLFHEDVPDSYLLQVFQTMRKAHWHTFQVLTKRHERLADFANSLRFDPATGEMWLGKPDGVSAMPLFKHIHLGVSVENRAELRRLDALRRAAAHLRFVSCEPLLEDLGEIDLTGIHWAIVGGESGPGARPFNVAWAYNLLRQCRAAGVPCFIKQLGANPYYVGFTEGWKKIQTKDRKGESMDEWPLTLRVREFPKTE